MSVAPGTGITTARRPAERAGALAGLAAAALLIAGYAAMVVPPGRGASDLDVYAYLLDHRDGLLAGGAMFLAGTLLLLPLFAALRTRIDPAGEDPRATAMLSSSVLAVAAATFFAAALIALAAGAPGNDPAAAQTVLGLAEVALAAAATFLAAALACFALSAGRSRRLGRGTVLLATLAAVLALQPAWALIVDGDGSSIGIGLAFTLPLVAIATWIALASVATWRGAAGQ